MAGSNMYGTPQQIYAVLNKVEHVDEKVRHLSVHRGHSLDISNGHDALVRTARGRADAKAKGVRFGRKPKLTPHQQREALERIEAGEIPRSVARSYNVSQATISRLTA